MTFERISSRVIMAVGSATVPQFDKGQRVNFVGGSGTIKNYHPELSNWVYLVEMDMGPEPEMGRVGYETTILLPQSDLALHEDDRCVELAISA
jgi:hypothetical protein